MSCVGVLKDRKKEHRKKEELQMLPGGFIDRGDEPCKIIFSGPFIEKVEKDSGDQRKNAESDFCIGMLLLKISHSNLRSLEEFI